jgi:hypothetical protein
MWVIIYAISMAYIWVEVLQIPYRFKRALNFKPFNCAVCLSGWFCVPLYGVSWSVIPVMCVAMIGQILLQGLIKKL